jgi:hypothetical protein
MTDELKCETCGEYEAIREIGAQWCHEAGVQEARAAAAETRIAVLLGEVEDLCPDCASVEPEVGMREQTMEKKHGVVVTGGRKQPYAVWVDGEIVLFTASRAEADAKLLAEEKRMGAKR